MATGTAASNPPVRQDPRQVSNTLKKTINFSDAGIASGLAFDNALPMAAFILSVLVEVVTVFNAATTNVITAGVNASTYNNLVNAGDINEGVAEVTSVTRGLGRALTAAGDVVPYVIYTQSGTAATTGQAIVVIQYEGGWST
jgi:hypothetical protein